MKKSPKAILTNQDPWIIEAISKVLPSTKMLFVYGTLLLNLVVGLRQFFVVNIQIGTQISTSYIS